VTDDVVKPSPKRQYQEEQVSYVKIVISFFGGRFNRGDLDRFRLDDTDVKFVYKQQLYTQSFSECQNGGEDVIVRSTNRYNGEAQAARLRHVNPGNYRV
jgi:hypothetical protein